MNAAFMAEARRVYIPALAWWKASGGAKYLYGGGWGSSTKFESKDSASVVEVFEVTNRLGGDCTRMTIAVGAAPDDVHHPTSITNAVDRLVVAGVLPVEFASWGRYVPAVDNDGDAVGFRDAGYPRHPGQQCYFVRPGTEAPTDWEPLFRRVPATASVTA